jgi:hypothetical protein
VAECELGSGNPTPWRPIADGRWPAARAETLGEFWALGTLLAIVRPQARPKSPNAPRLRTRARQAASPPPRQSATPPLQSAGFELADSELAGPSVGTNGTRQSWIFHLILTPEPPVLHLCLAWTTASLRPSAEGGRLPPSNRGLVGAPPYWIESAAPPGVDDRMFAGAAERAQPHFEQ